MSARTTSLLLGSWLVALLALPQGARAQVWFPLEVGLRWTYTLEKGGGAQFLTVERQEGDFYILDRNGSEIAVTAEGPDIVLPGEGRQVYYRFDSDSWLHRDDRSCEDLRIMTVTARDESVRTPFADLTGCIRIDYEPGGPCADSGVFSEWWAPDIGLVKWVEQSFIGERTWVLADFGKVALPVTFRRGDAGGDGAVDLSDPISVLSWLFLSGSAPGCLDAADTNDDGGIDLSDAIGVLTYLFLGGTEIPPPGPTACGQDPTNDDPLEECDPGACGPAGLSGD